VDVVYSVDLQFFVCVCVYLSAVMSAQVMRMLALRPSGQYCTDRVVHSCVSFVNSAIELSNLYKLLKPHLVSKISPQCNTYDIRTRTTGATAVYYL
jgi:hypothetical protein